MRDWSSKLQFKVAVSNYNLYAPWTSFSPTAQYTLLESQNFLIAYRKISKTSASHYHLWYQHFVIVGQPMMLLIKNTCLLKQTLESVHLDSQKSNQNVITEKELKDEKTILVRSME